MALPRTRTTFATVALLVTALAWALHADPASAWFLEPTGSASTGGGASTTLYWIALVLAVLIAVAVNLALVGLLRRNRAERGSAPQATSGDRRTQIRVGGALAVATVVLFAIGVIFTEKSMDVEASASTSSEPVRIKATGQQWLWRYDYPDQNYSYFRLTIPVDTEIVLDVLSTDVVHSWNVPALAGKADAVPGKRNRIRFRADREGVFPGASSVLSGQAYAAMRTEVAVVSQEEYEEFLTNRARDNQAAQDAAARSYAERQDD